MKVNENFKSQHLRYLKSYLPEEITKSAEFQNAVLANLDNLTELGTSDVCTNRQKALGLSLDARDLAERILKLSDGTEFIAGARFKNLDIHFPFVEINLSSAATTSQIKEISSLVQSEFKNLHPKGLKFKDRPNLHQSYEKWSHTVFGNIEKHESFTSPLGIDFSFTQNLEWHPQYVHEYKERLSEKTELSGFVRIGDLDEFQEAAADEALLVANDTEGFAGVIAGINSPIYGLPAIYMIESYLSKRWVGKKIAPIAHATFLNEMAKRYNYVWGTIYDKNVSSLNTALRIGRRIIETEYFVRFDN